MHELLRPAAALPQALRLIQFEALRGGYLLIEKTALRQIEDNLARAILERGAMRRPSLALAADARRSHNPLDGEGGGKRHADLCLAFLEPAERDAPPDHAGAERLGPPDKTVRFARRQADLVRVSCGRNG